MVKRGVCGTCGTAVVAPDNPKEGWNESETNWFGTHTADFRDPSYGHFFQAGKLVRVRCFRCAYVEKHGLGG